MKRLLVCALGSHDFKIEKEFKNEFSNLLSEDLLNNQNTHTRDIGKKILESVNKEMYIEKLKKNKESFFPLFSSYMDKLDYQSNDYNRIILLVTDQEIKHKQDTYFIGQILKEVYSDLLNVKFRIELIDQNPSNYALMMKYAQERFEKILKKEINKQNYESIFLGITGGTPAINFALFSNFHFLEEIKILYKPNTNNSSTQQINVKNEMKVNFIKNYLSVIKNENEYIDYKVLNYLFLSVKKENLAVISRFSNEFFSMRFKKAADLLEDFYSTGVEEKLVGFNIDEISKRIRNFNEVENSIFILNEFIRNDFINKNFENLAVRIVSILEFYIIYIIEKTLDMKMKNYKKFQEKIIKNNGHIKNFYDKEKELRANKIDLKDLGFNYRENWNLSWSNFSNFIIDVFALKDQLEYRDEFQYISIIEITKELYALKTVRNDLAHSVYDFGEEEEELTKKYKGYIGKLGELHELVIGKKFQSIFEKINAILQEGF